MRVIRSACRALFLAAALVLLVSPSLGANGDVPPGTHAWWVFFADRGDVGGGAADLAAAARAIAPESWAARAVSPAGAVVDERDLPLAGDYVRAIAAEGRVRHASRWLNAVSADLTPAALARVRALPFVGEVRPVARATRQGLGPRFAPDGTPLGTTHRVRATEPRGPFPYGPAYGQLLEIQVPAVHAEGYTGNRVRMMMLDTGFRKDHLAFANARLLAEYDYVFEDGDVQNEAEDDPGQHNHGTGCWAVAGGYDAGVIVGPAYGATFVLCKTEDVRSETQAEEDNYVAALEWAESLGVRVTSASLSYTCFDDGACYDFPLKDGDTPVISRAVDIAAARGILCVNAAGKYGWEGAMSLGTPADADTMLSVGAVDSLNLIAGFSSRGPSDDGRIKPEVVARGADTWWADAEESNAYGFASGTSLSCPLVGGTAALLAEAHPEWSNLQIRAALMNTADRHTAPDNDYGWGRIDALAALHSSPVVFPKPFDLDSPPDGAVVSSAQPVLRWRSTVDPDENGPLTYTAVLRENIPGGQSWLLAAGADSAVAVPFGLVPGRSYRWEVRADDLDGHRRVSREERVFTVNGSASAPEASATPALQLRLGPNPFSTEVRGSLVNAPASGRWAVYDPIGRKVAGSDLQAGSFTWDARGRDGAAVPAGVYFLEVNTESAFVRETLVKLR